MTDRQVTIQQCLFVTGKPFVTNFFVRRACKRLIRWLTSVVMLSYACFENVMDLPEFHLLEISCNS